MILTVPDPDSTLAKAIASGAREVFAVEEAHRWRLGRVADPFGRHWKIGRPHDCMVVFCRPCGPYFGS